MSMKKRVKITKAPLKKAKTGTHIGLENYFKSSMQKDPGLNQFGEEPVSVRKTITNTKSTPNIEAEGGEFIAQPGQAGMIDTFKIKGKPHSRGGVKLAAEPGAFIYSQYKKMAIKDPEILKFFGLSPRKKGYTPAEIAMRFDNSKFSEVLLNPDTDKIEKETAERMMKKNNLMLSYLALYVESEKGFQEGIPEIGNIALEKNGIDPNQILPQQKQEQQQMMAADESMAKLGNFIKSYKTGGMYKRMYQGGGPIPMQQGSAPGEEVMMMIQQMMEQGAQPQDVIIELLNQGVEPQTIQEALLAIGMPPEQVVPMIEEVIAMAQGQMQQGPSPEEAAMMAQQGMAPEAQALMEEPPMAKLGRFLQRAQISEDVDRIDKYEFFTGETTPIEYTDPVTGEVRVTYEPTEYLETGRQFNVLTSHEDDMKIPAKRKMLDNFLRGKWAGGKYATEADYLKDYYQVGPSGKHYRPTFEYDYSTNFDPIKGFYKSGGSYDNPGFRALPQYVQDKIKGIDKAKYSKSTYGAGGAYPMYQASGQFMPYMPDFFTGNRVGADSIPMAQISSDVPRKTLRKIKRNDPEAYQALTSGGTPVRFPFRRRQKTQNNPGIMMIDGVYYVYDPTVGQLVPLDPNVLNQIQSNTQGGQLSSRPTAKKNVPEGRIITEDDYNSGDPTKVEVGDYVKKADGTYHKVIRVPVKSPIAKRDYQGSDTWGSDNADFTNAVKNKYQYLSDVLRDEKVKKEFADRVRAAAKDEKSFERKNGGYSDFWSDAGKKASFQNKIDNMTNDQIVDLHLKMQRRNMKLQTYGVDAADFSDAQGKINWSSLTQQKKDKYNALGLNQNSKISDLFNAIGEPVGGWGSEEVALEQITHWGYTKLAMDKDAGNLDADVTSKLYGISVPNVGAGDEPYGKISPADGYYTDTSAFELDNVNLEDDQGELKPWDEPYDPETPGFKGYIPKEYWKQDMINIGTDLANWMSAKEYGPWSKRVEFGRPDLILRSPMTDLNQNLAQQKIQASALGAYGQGMQGLGYTLSDVAGRGLEGSAKILADVANYNIPAVQQYYDKALDLETKEDLYNAERLGKDYAGWVTMRQGADNFNRAMRRQLGTDLMQAETNAAKAQVQNMLTPNWNIRPSYGGDLEFAGGTPLTGQDSGSGLTAAELYAQYKIDYPDEAATLEGRKRLSEQAIADAKVYKNNSSNAALLQQYNQLMPAAPAQNIYGG